MWNIVVLGLIAATYGLIPNVRLVFQGEPDAPFIHWSIQCVWELARWL